MKTVCLYCDQEDSGVVNKYKPPPEKDFICSLCVQLLLESSQERLKLYYDLANINGDDREAWARESFLIDKGEKIDRKRNDQFSRHHHRTGFTRPVGTKKVTTGLHATGKKASVLQTD